LGIACLLFILQKIPTELIYERQSDLKSNEPLYRVRAENRLRKFLKKLEDEDAGYNKRRNIFNLIKNFYSHFGLDLNMRCADAPKGESGKFYPFTKELLQKVLEVCDVRERALVLLMKDSGQAVAEIASLKLAHFGSDGENLDPEKWPIPIKLTRKKTRSKIQTFVGEEAIHALNVYFDLRRRGTTELYKGRWYGKKGLQPEVLSGESPVIARKCGGILVVKVFRI
jgi:integrase